MLVNAIKNSLLAQAKPNLKPLQSYQEAINLRQRVPGTK
tara:strand:- start:2001 stop:2117 length:117 start_codon:yes stop_codon:yes gene_type:complete